MHELTPYQKLKEWNSRLLKILNEQIDKTVLGYLPVFAPDRDEMIEALKETFAERAESKKPNMMTDNATSLVTSYIMVYILSSLEKGKGKGVWSPIGEKIGYEPKTAWDKKLLPQAVEKINERLGEPKLLILENKPTKGEKAPNFQFQCGIRRYWSEDLKRRLNKVALPLPELDDSHGLRDYADALIEGDKPFDRVIKSEVGVLLVKKLCLFEQGAEDSLPDYLVEIFKLTKEGRKSKSKQIREPYLEINNCGELFLIFPKLKPSSQLGEESYWVFRNVKTRVFKRDIRKETIEWGYEYSVALISGSGKTLKDLQFNTLLNKDQPFKLFRAADKREVKIDLQSSISVTAGDYYVVLAPEATAGKEDDAYCSKIDAQGILEWRNEDIPLGIDLPFLEISLSDKSYSVRCGDGFDMHLDTESDSYLETEDLPLTFCKLPLMISASDNETLTLMISFEGYEEITPIDITEGWQKKVQELLEYTLYDDPVKVTLTLENELGTKKQVSCVYWKSVKDFNPHNGFTLNSIDGINSHTGWSTDLPNTLFYSDQDTELYREITTADSGVIRIPKPGLVLMLREDSEDEGRIIRVGETILLNQEETREVCFQSNGIEEWEIYGDEISPLVSLGKKKRGRKRPKKETRLLSYLAEHSQEAALIAKNSQGVKKTLMRIQKPFLTPEKVSWNHEYKYYAFDVPVGGISYIGYTVNDIEGNGITPLTSLENNWGDVLQDDTSRGIKITGSRKEDYYQLEIENLDRSRLPFGASIYSFFVKGSNADWLPLLTSEQDKKKSSLPVRFPFWGKFWSKEDNTTQEYLDFHRYLSKGETLDVTRPLFDAFYDPNTKNLNSDYIKGNYTRDYKKWWFESALDFTLLSKENIVVEREPNHLPAMCAELLTADSKFCKIEGEGLIERTLNLSAPELLWTGFTDCREPSGSRLKFSLKDYLYNLKEESDNLDYAVKERNIADLLSPEHFSFCLNEMEKRATRTLDTAEDSFFEEKALNAYDRIWDKSIRDKERKDFEKLLNQCKLQNFGDIRGKMWFPIKEGENTFCHQLSYIMFRVAFIARAAANQCFADTKDRQSNTLEFQDRFQRIFHNNGFKSLLQFAPELLSFYLLMFDQSLKTIKTLR